MLVISVCVCCEMRKIENRCSRSLRMRIRKESPAVLMLLCLIHLGLAVLIPQHLVWEGGS